MNKRLPYEEQLAEQLNDVSLPDENMAWADMKRRLEKDDDDRIIPFWLNGCFLWTLIGVVMLGLGWWFIRPEHWFKRKKSEIHQTSKSRQGEKQQNNSSQKPQLQPKLDSTIFYKNKVKQQNRTTQNETKETVSRTNKSEISQTSTTKKNIRQRHLNEEGNRSEQIQHDSNLLNNRNPVAESKHVKVDDPDSLRQRFSDNFKTADTQRVIVANIDSENQVKDSGSRNTKTKQAKRDSAGSPEFSFAVGLSLNQQLPIGGQSFVPYNREGRKGTLTDYIPSVYIRMYHKNNWFIQSEFRYGAPQYTKEFVYQQRSDSAINGFITQSTSLKKTYYHQLPLTFNYYVSKNFSVGTGVVWNRFVSAISSQDVVKHNDITGTDSIISKGTILVSKTNDSGNVFARSWFQALFQAEYKWNRFSLGARYAIGLEPYIKFELQPGVPQQEKNTSLDIFIRYELWRSKKK